MTVKKIAGRLHLWLGLTTGLVVVVIALTGAIYCFAPELQSLQSYRKVREENKAFLPPSQLQLIAQKALPGKVLQRIYYEDRNKAVMTLFGKKDEYSYSVFINPYSGQVLKVRDNDSDFLSVVLKIHRTLNIPYGHDIIRWSTVIFILMLLTGIILWWPKNRRVAKVGYRIMWRASPKRLNYDLHKVLGFYASWIVLFSALTGLLFAFESFADLTYRVTGYRHSIVQKKPPLSDTTNVAVNSSTATVDMVWKTVAPDLHGKYAGLMFVLSAAKSGPILVRANPYKETLYKTDFRYFDQHSGKEIPGAYVWGRYTDAKTLADNIKRMNYDVHTGALFGLPGRIALFFVALVTASLPVTGFYFWWGRKKKTKRSSRKPVRKESIRV
jgi:uncharacterized iron-regulated membrane protein